MSEKKNLEAVRCTRKTKETEVTVELCLGVQKAAVRTGIGFFDHLLSALGFHGRLGLQVTAQGDLHVDYHHTVEDVGLTMGEAFRGALGSDPKVARFGSAAVPMDEALALAAVDISGRGTATVDQKLTCGRVRDFDACLVREFLSAFARQAGITVHVQLLCGGDTHHSLEAAFKAFGRALAQAVAPASGEVPSTKGTLDPGLSAPGSTKA